MKAFGRRAEIAGEYLHKGSRVYLEGRKRTESWDDKKTGGKNTGILFTLTGWSSLILEATAMELTGPMKATRRVQCQTKKFRSRGRLVARDLSFDPSLALRDRHKRGFRNVHQGN